MAAAKRPGFRRAKKLQAAAAEVEARRAREQAESEALRVSMEMRAHPLLPLLQAPALALDHEIVL